MSACTPAPRGERRGLAARLDALLPQWQCGSCGFRDCAAYAAALAVRSVPPDRCAPAGDAGARALAGALGTGHRGVDRAWGVPGPPRAARVVEERCIGCTLCLGACPLDAIVGARLHMHTVIEVECSGCGLCLDPCPVECIELVEPDGADAAWTARRAARARTRHQAHRRRLAEGAGSARAGGREALRAEVMAAVERERRRRARAGALG